MNTITATDHVGTLAARIPSAAQIFFDRGIDFCCGGDKELDEACADANQPTVLIIEELEQAAVQYDESEIAWEEAPLDDLIAFIEQTFHRPLDASLPRLREWTDAVVAAHGDHTKEQVQRLRDVVHELADELAAHMAKEEQVLFPWIRSGNGQNAGGPIRVMHAEHDSAGRQLALIRFLTRNFSAPEEACVTWRLLYAALERLDEELRHHIHLENNVLFPRALAESAA